MGSKAVGRHFPLYVGDRHFEYLSLQRGRISDLRHDRQAWEKAYHSSLFDDYEGMLPFLPEKPPVILDIACGLAGIDILLAHHYERMCHITLMDGQDDPPEFTAHDRTFNNMRVAQDFMAKNGIYFADVHALDDPKAYRSYDLILSLQGWCFHLEPQLYLDFVRRAANQNAVLIIDVRRKPEWQDLLDEHLEAVAVISKTDKSRRMVYRVR